MKAKEIRNTEIQYDVLGKVDLTIALFLREIAAQLADLNEHLRMVDESVFGAKDAKEKDKN